MPSIAAPSPPPGPPVETWCIRVTGVSPSADYRGFVRATARCLGVRGWVHADAGHVTIEVQARPDAVEDLVVALMTRPPGDAATDVQPRLIVDGRPRHVGFVIVEQLPVGDGPPLP